MPEPLHPAIVHFPIVLAMLLPLVALVALLWSRQEGAPRWSWGPVAFLAVAVAASSFVAIRTGEAQEDRVESVVSESVIHEHEEAGEAMLAGSVLVAGIILLGLLPGRIGAVGRYAGTVATLIVVGLVYQVGKSGGELVYEHGAASAYATNAPGEGVFFGTPADDEDDDHAGRRR